MPNDGNEKSAQRRRSQTKTYVNDFWPAALMVFTIMKSLNSCSLWPCRVKIAKMRLKTALKRFKTLQGVLEATSRELSKVNGIGPKNIFGIKLIKAVADRYLEKKLIHKDAINDSKALFDYLYHSIGDKNREFFKVIFLNSKNQVIGARTISEGTLTASSVYPREVIQAALSHDAAALIFAHNHPSGDPKPSSEDVAVTRQLVFAGKVMGMVVHEHLIIGDNRYFSFADQGYIVRMNREFEKLTEKGT